MFPAFEGVPVPAMAPNGKGVAGAAGNLSTNCLVSVAITPAFITSSFDDGSSIAILYNELLHS